ncbi:MAG: hypothetical protein AAFX00_08080 [Pseudomonadota bacterium]
MFATDAASGFVARLWAFDFCAPKATDRDAPPEYLIALRDPLPLDDWTLRMSLGVQLRDHFEWGGQQHIVVRAPDKGRLSEYLAVRDPMGRAEISRLLVSWDSPGMEGLDAFQKFAFATPVAR